MLYSNYSLSAHWLEAGKPGEPAVKSEKKKSFYSKHIIDREGSTGNGLANACCRYLMVNSSARTVRDSGSVTVLTK